MYSYNYVPVRREVISGNCCSRAFARLAVWYAALQNRGSVRRLLTPKREGRGSAYRCSVRNTPAGARGRGGVPKRAEYRRPRRCGERRPSRSSVATPMRPLSQKARRDALAPSCAADHARTASRGLDGAGPGGARAVCWKPAAA